MRSIDITGWKQTGQELVKEISDAVDAEAKLLFVEIPSKLILTTRQYNSLVSGDYFIPMHDPGVSQSGIIYRDRVEASKDQMFLTKEGYPLEVEVSDVIEEDNDDTETHES